LLQVATRCTENFLGGLTKSVDRGSSFWLSAWRQGDSSNKSQ